jgi:hypothetical protein
LESPFIPCKDLCIIGIKGQNLIIYGKIHIRQNNEAKQNKYNWETLPREEHDLPVMTTSKY